MVKIRLYIGSYGNNHGCYGDNIQYHSRSLPVMLALSFVVMVPCYTEYNMVNHVCCYTLCNITQYLQVTAEANAHMIKDKVIAEFATRPHHTGSR